MPIAFIYNNTLFVFSLVWICNFLNTQPFFNACYQSVLEELLINDNRLTNSPGNSLLALTFGAFGLPRLY